MDEFYNDVRLFVYGHFVREGQAPTIAQISKSLGPGPDRVRQTLAELYENHVLVPHPDSGEIGMAMPFSGQPTAYRVAIGKFSWWANCAWDAFAILALLGDGSVVITSSDRSEAVWTVDAGVVAPEGFVHFVVPPRRFWDDIGFT